MSIATFSLAAASLAFYNKYQSPVGTTGDNLNVLMVALGRRSRLIPAIPANIYTAGPVFAVVAGVVTTIIFLLFFAYMAVSVHSRSLNTKKPVAMAWFAHPAVMLVAFGFSLGSVATTFAIHTHSSILDPYGADYRSPRLHHFGLENWACQIIRYPTINDFRGSSIKQQMNTQCNIGIAGRWVQIPLLILSFLAVILAFVEARRSTEEVPRRGKVEMDLVEQKSVWSEQSSIKTDRGGQI
ncbi:MAG: hypothetical protein M1814_003602 [Vezdaea aestivalis]|nr:MAG: hypothetical protein M1814_003602 [Vezdaea aestivalis]